jgi:putative Holliday junction resolvase
MRVLGLDYGSARCGCALADPTGTIVTPIDAVQRPATRRGFDALAALVTEQEVERIVVGLPLSLSGEESAQTHETREWAARLARRVGEGVPVELHDERLTTRMAQRMEDTQTSEDSRAAALMLESWLATSPSGLDRGSPRERHDQPASPSSPLGGSRSGGGPWR